MNIKILEYLLILGILDAFFPDAFACHNWCRKAPAWDSGKPRGDSCPSNTFWTCFRDRIFRRSQCETCGPNAISPPNSLSFSQCQCPAGMYASVNTCPFGCLSFDKGDCGSSSQECFCQHCELTCSTCPPNTYSVSANRNSACSPCYAGSTGPAGSTSISNCVCNENSYLLNGVCVQCPQYATSPIASTSASQCSCPANMFMQNGACNACPPGSNSPAGSTTCVCNPGTGWDGISCNTCPKNYFGSPNQLSFGDARCTACPANAVTDNAGATSIGECKCPPGYFGDGRIGCIACSQGYFSDIFASILPNCRQCGPKETTTSVGSTACVCKEGYFKPPGSNECQECPVGTYKTGAGDATSCTSCGNGATTPQIGSTSANQCNCPAGMGNMGGACAQCSATSIASQSGSMTSATCTQCGPNEVANEARTACICKSGYFRDGGSCVACFLGSFKPMPGDGACTRCGSGMVTASIGSVDASACVCEDGFGQSGGSCTVCNIGSYRSVQSGSTTCIQCPLGGTTLAPAATSINSCGCLPGFGRASISSPCTLCPVNTYSLAFSTQATITCQQCPPGTSTNGIIGSLTCLFCAAGQYGIGPNNCQACPQYFSTSAPTFGSTIASCIRTSCPSGYQLVNGECLCAKGFYDNGSGCSACPRGATTLQLGAKSVAECGCIAGSAGSPQSSGCTVCSVNTYGNVAFSTGNSVCNSCATGLSTNGATGQTSCDSCIPGYYGTSPNCFPCPANTIMPTANSNTNSCQACPAGAVSIQGSTACACDVGYGGTISTGCVKCPTNSVKSNVGDGTCQCLAGYGGVAAVSGCPACPVNTFKASAGDAQCTSCPSFTSTNGTTAQTSCSSCILGAYRDPTVPATPLKCILCPIGQYQNSYSTLTTCSTCPQNATTSIIGSATCDVCIPGYFRNGYDVLNGVPTNSICSPCPKDTYVPTADKVETCFSCPEGMTSEPGSASCTCKENYYYNTAARTCVVCPTGTFKSGINNNTVCDLCAKEYYRDATSGFCTICPVETTTYRPSNATSCVPICRGQNFIHDGSSCVCDIGYIMVNGNCMPVDVGFYKNSTGNATTGTPCPTGATTATTGSISINQCGCLPGYAGSPQGAGCFKCPADTIGNAYFSVNATECTNCIVSLSTNGAIGQTTCSACNAGYVGTAPYCLPCSGASYMPIANAQLYQCYTCPPGSVSNKNATACSCNAGYQGSTAENCSSCPVDTYKDFVGFGTCSPCANNTSTCEQKSQNSCPVCKLGMYKDASVNNTLSCLPCPMGTWKSIYSTDTECLPCPISSTTTSTGSISCDYCLPGFYQAFYSYSNNGITYSSCASCEAASYMSDINNATSCIRCPEGMTSKPGSSSCVCKEGYSYDATSQSCLSCPDGSWKVGDGNATDCATCHPTYYREVDGSCKSCPTGYASDTSGNTTSCSMCAPNYYRDARNTTDLVCLPCAAGTTNAVGNLKTVCEFCVVGYYSSGTGCQKCATGSMTLEPNKETYADGNCPVCAEGFVRNFATGACVEPSSYTTIASIIPTAFSSGAVYSSLPVTSGSQGTTAAAYGSLPGATGAANQKVGEDADATIVAGISDTTFFIIIGVAAVVMAVVIAVVMVYRADAKVKKEEEALANANILSVALNKTMQNMSRQPSITASTRQTQLPQTSKPSYISTVAPSTMAPMPRLAHVSSAPADRPATSLSTASTISGRQTAHMSTAPTIAARPSFVSSGSTVTANTTKMTYQTRRSSSSRRV